MPVSSVTEHWIKPDAITINLNHFGDPDYLQVSVLAGAVVMAFKQDVISYNAAHNYRTWPLQAANTYLETTSAYNVYARLSRSEVNASALIVYDPILRDIEGRPISYSEDGSELLGDADSTYYYVFLGQISSSIGSSGQSTSREWTVDFRFGSLDTSQYRNEESGGEWQKMFRLNKVTDMIDVLKTFSSAVFKRLFIGEKEIHDIKRSIDSDEAVLVSDSTIPTTQYLHDKLGNIDDKYLRKDQDDSTPYNLGIGGNLILKDKPIAELTRFYDEKKPEHATDVAIYSALMTEKAIEASLGDLGDKYLRKDKEDTAHKRITFEEGITVYDLAKMLNLEVSELATIARAVIKAGEGMNEYITSDRFVDGFFGEGFRIWHDLAAGNWNLTLDNLTVRKVMMIYELVIQKIRAVGGMLVVSAGNGKIKEVTRVGLEYKFTFEDTNTFAENDLIRCQVFSQNRLKYYWVEVTRVEGEDVYTRVADYNGVVPEEGDECVLMGNTKNIKRQNLILVSATEDGQPRFDCYDGIKSKNFEGCLRTRVGNLDGIHDDRFPVALQPKGYGLYADNCFLTGVFVLSTGVEVGTQFSIMEGMIRSEISSVRAEINAKDNYLANASFAANLDLWEYENDVHVFDTAGGLLHFNGQFYSDKRIFAGVVVKDSKNVLRIKNSYICQKKEDYNIQPNFDIYEDEETGVSLYRPRMFYVSFKYMVASSGTLRVFFKNEANDGTWEEYEPIYVNKAINATTAFAIFETEGKWNGTGDFYISFDGDIFICDLALSDNALADVEEKFTSRFEQTDKKIQANLDHTIGKLEEYHSEFTLTAESLESSFNAKITNQYNTITSEYSSEITQTAKELRSEYTELVEDTESGITSSYKSAISQTAREIRAELSAEVETLDGLITEANASISATAETLRSDYSKKITDLKTGEIKNLQSSITQTAEAIRTEVSSIQKDLSGKITKNTSSITQNAKAIELRATTSTVDALTKRVTTAESNITTAAGNISALSKKLTFDSSGNLTNISKSGLVLDSEFATMFSTQVTSQGIAKIASLSAYVLETELGDLVSKIDISADQINLTGVVTYSMLSSSLKGTLDGKATSVELTNAQTALNNSISKLNTTIGTIQTDLDKKATITSLNSKVEALNTALASKANKDMSNAAISGSTLIVNGYINTDFIDVNTLLAKKVVTNGDTYGVITYMHDGEIGMKDSSSVQLLRIFSNGSSSNIRLTDTSSNDILLLPSSSYFSFSNGKKLSIGATNGLEFTGGMGIKRFAISSITSTLSADGDFCIIGGNYTLPSASSNKGRVIWVYATKDITISGSIYNSNGSSASSVACKGMNFFVSNGSAWYRGYCQ